MNTQFKKGVLEICVLSYLAEKDFYGYELVEAISINIHMSEGTIYPLLRRFSNDGLVETYLKESQSGPPRKYYRLTGAGNQYYQEQLKDWTEFSEQVNKILRRQINV
ncbi:PadR family transcriptional regulator [Clostridiales bacterium COT073_COT-073]|nr:PadR family transcriptional regulator [Clostridiales bacterium COT073_COT-073]